MNAYITRCYAKDNKYNAGGKAPTDINEICKQKGWKQFKMNLPSGEIGQLKRIYWRIFYCSIQWIKLGINRYHYILYQYPMQFGIKLDVIMVSIIRKIFKSKFIILIHDLETLRHNSSETEIDLIKACDYVICHNDSMKQYLISKGVEKTKAITLNAFDYLCDVSNNVCDICYRKKGISIAGNLLKQKCGYLYKFIESNPDLQINLYGVGYDQSENYQNVNYYGSFKPEELPKKMEASYGIVWDGPDITACTGEYGEYLKYNNPHKLSLYMAAGIPVITWKQAAIAEFVKENQVGITVESLENLSKELEKISDEEYLFMRKNAEKIGEKVRQGWYLQKAIEEIVARDK